MKKIISTCPVTGLKREIELMAINKNINNKTAQIGVKINRYKDGELLTAKGLGPYGLGITIANEKKNKDYDKLVDGKIDEEIFNGVIEWADSKKLFDK